MAKIKVTPDKLEKTANAVDTYLAEATNQMKKANQNVNVLAATWQGQDASQFVTEWNQVDDADSTFGKMNKSLASYAKYLRYAADEYRRAQRTAVQRAYSIPKF